MVTQNSESETNDQSVNLSVVAMLKLVQPNALDSCASPSYKQLSTGVNTGFYVVKWHTYGGLYYSNDLRLKPRAI